MAVGNVVFGDAQLIAQRMAHFLHVGEGAVVEIARIAVALSAAPLKRHAVVDAATLGDFIHKGN